MVLDKKSPIFFDKAFTNLTIIMLACLSVTKETSFFSFFNMHFQHRKWKHSKRKLFVMCLDVV